MKTNTRVTVLSICAACITSTAASLLLMVVGVDAFGANSVVAGKRTTSVGTYSSGWLVSSATSSSIAASSSSSRLAVVAAAAPPPAAAAAVNGVNGEHGGANNAPAGVEAPSIRLNINEKARTVTSVCTSGTLCTVSTHEGIEGAPFGSFVDYVLDDEGNPVLLMNDMSMHTINIREASSAAAKDGSDAAAQAGRAMVTLFTQLGSASSPTDSVGTGPLAMSQGGGGKSKGLQDVSRCSVTGVLEKIEPTAQDWDSIRMRYALTHAYADQVMDSPKFAFYRLVPRRIYFVGGFGVLAKWVDVDEYRLAAPDILARDAPDIIRKINRDHGEDLKLTARHLLNVQSEIENIRVTSVDRLGMDIRVTFQTGTRRNKLLTDEFRIGFRIPVISVEDAKSEILKVFQEAWEKGNGYTWDVQGASTPEVEQPGENVPIVKIAADSLE